MKVSYKELNKLIDLSNISPYDLANKLTFAGIEVESVEKLSEASNLVIGEVIDCQNMAESDHLHLTKVDVKDEILDIVCGAPNVRKGLKVIVAKVGAKLKEITIKKSQILGHESNGMLCSLVELGVDKKYLSEAQINGIEELDDNAVVGNSNVLEYLGLDDYILDLKLLANRSDCNSLLNVAKEVSALYNLKFKEPNLINLPKEDNEIVFNLNSKTELCPKFVSRVIKNIKIKQSPKWLIYALRSFGIRSINNIVDIGNYVMVITGQPLHMYDLDKLESNELYCDLSNNEKFVALDEKEYQLTDSDLVIRSKNEIESLAGVMGSLGSSTSDNTKNIVIESAIFDPKSVRLTSSRLGLSSESSLRFTKGIDPTNQEIAVDYAASLVCELAETNIVSKRFEFNKIIYKDKEIESSYSYINNRLGTKFEKNIIKNALNRVFINVKDLDEDKFIAVIPHHRIDITDQADLSEEVIRLLGFDNVESVLPTMRIAIGGLNENKKKETLFKDLLINNGFYETLTYTLVNKEMSDDFNILLKDEPIIIKNPLTVDHSILRRSLIPSLLKVVNYNLNRKITDFKLFEVSNLYSKNNSISALSCVLTGNNLYQGNLNKIKFSFFDLKAIVETIFEILGIQKTRYKLEQVEKENRDLNFGKSAYLKIGNKICGYLGEIHPYVYKKYEIKTNSNVYVMEINLNEIYQLKVGQIKSKELSKFPDVKRDIALVADKSISVATIEKEIKLSSSLLSDVSLFDVFVDDELNKNNLKSVAFNLTFTSFDHTLKENEINEEVEKIINNLKNKLKIELRK